MYKPYFLNIKIFNHIVWKCMTFYRNSQKSTTLYDFLYDRPKSMTLYDLVWLYMTVETLIYRCRDFVPLSVLLSMYYAFVFPYLNYCNLIWGGTFSTHLQPVRVMQKKILRLVNFQPYNSHSSPLFKKCNILKLDDLHLFKKSVFMFIRGDAEFTRQHNYDTRFRNNLIPAFHRLTSSQRSITYTGPTTWNTLPDSLKNIDNFVSFKRSLKKYLVSGYVWALTFPLPVHVNFITCFYHFIATLFAH